MIRTIIVDDEPKARNSLKVLINKFVPDLQVVGESGSIDDAYLMILEEKPDLVFLDIEIPPNTGFDLIEKFSKRNFEVIFITAYSKYAIQAIRASALDYIVKPIIAEELVNAVSKVITKKNETPLTAFPRDKKIVLSDANIITRIVIIDIVRCEAFRNYTTFHFIQQEKFTVSKPIGDYEELLCNDGFIRVHNSHLVNVHNVLYFDKLKCELVMKDDSRVPVSRRKRENLLRALQS